MKRLVYTICLSLCGVLVQAQDQPNVIIMLADNLGYGDVGVYGAGEIRGMPTPNIDKLADEGLRMTQFLVEPGCTPSRAGLMTGEIFNSTWAIIYYCSRNSKYTEGRGGDLRRNVQIKRIQYFLCW